MSTSDLTSPVVVETITYPESDGKPMADNTKQFRWITTLAGNLEILFEHEPDVFIAGNILWYPVEGNNQLRAAPDVMVIFGRPKGDRSSYLQWREGGISPQVVFEILSPGNTIGEMESKFIFYERYGVEEYYLYDPDSGRLQGWLRRGRKLEEIEDMIEWVSPHLGVRFDLEGLDLVLYTPAGDPFLTFLELNQRRQEAEIRAEKAEARAEAEAQARVEAEVRAKELEAKLKQAGLL